MDYVIPAPPVVSLPVDGDERRFPVRRVYCVGRNYVAHAREMGHDPDREPPFFFTKPADALVPGDGTIPYPPATADLHHEVELVVALGKGGADIPEAQALDHVFGYGVGIDLTRRDLQAEAKQLRRPWDMAKAFDRSAPVSALRPAARIGHPENNPIRLLVNGQVRQESTLAHHIWSVAETIAYLSGLVELAPGDLIFMGTPEGVAAVGRGDVLEASIEGVGELRVTIA
ncbi:MAG: fumarylacetoacetate hydrolase family protein [Geminicoccaceae bacterium]